MRSSRRPCARWPAAWTTCSRPAGPAGRRWDERRGRQARGPGRRAGAQPDRPRRRPDPQRPAVGRVHDQLPQSRDGRDITLDPSGLDARFGGRLSSVVNLETRDGTTERALAASGIDRPHERRCAARGPHAGHDTGSWWATARGTYYRLVTDRFSDGAMPSFGDVQFKTTLSPDAAHTRLTLFGLAGRETLLESNAIWRTDGRDAHRAIAATTALAPRRCAGRRPRASAARRRCRRTRPSRTTSNFAGCRRFRFRRFDRRIGMQRLSRCGTRCCLRVLAGARYRRRRRSASASAARGRWAASKQPEWWRGIGPSTWGELVDYCGRADRLAARADASGSMVPGPARRWPPDDDRARHPRRLELVYRRGRVAAAPARVARVRPDVGLGGFLDAGADPVAREPAGLRVPRFLGELDAVLRNARTQQIVAGSERPIGGGCQPAGRGLPPHVRSAAGAAAGNRGRAPESPCRLRSSRPDLPPDAVILEYRPTVFPESTGTGRAAGVEFLLRRDRRRVTGWLGYTLSKSTRDLYGRTVPSDFDRRHALNAVVDVPLCAPGGERRRRGSSPPGFRRRRSTRKCRSARVNNLDGTPRSALPHVPRPERQSGHDARDVFHAPALVDQQRAPDGLLRASTCAGPTRPGSTGSSTARSQPLQSPQLPAARSTTRTTRASSRGHRQVQHLQHIRAACCRSACG